MKDCRGGFNLQSSATTLDCKTFDGEHGSSSVIKGTYKCSGSVTNPGGLGTSGTGAKKGNAISIQIPSGGILIGLLGAVAAFMGTL